MPGQPSSRPSIGAGRPARRAGQPRTRHLHYTHRIRTQQADTVTKVIPDSAPAPAPPATPGAQPTPGTPTTAAPGWGHTNATAGGRARRRWLTAVLWLGAGSVLAWMLLRLSGWGDFFPLVQLLAFTPYVLPVALLVTVLCGVLRRWSACFVALAAVLGLAAAVLPRTFGDASADAGGVHLRVLSANMKVGIADADNLVALIRAHDVDVLALQEFTFAARDRLRAAGLESLLPNQASFPDDGVGGSALYSRYPLTGIGYRPLPPFFGQAFGLLHLPDGTSIRVESAHPCAPSERDRVSGWRAGLAMQPRADHGTGPQLLFGDFNATLDHGPMRDLLASGYTDAAVQLGDGLVPTWPYDGTWVPKVTLDHVLVAGLRVYAFATYPNPGSDHRAVYAELGLPTA